MLYCKHNNISATVVLAFFNLVVIVIASPCKLPNRAPSLQSDMADMIEVQPGVQYALSYFNADFSLAAPEKSL